MSPSVQSATTPASADFLREMHPNRVYFSAFSDRNPWMAPIAGVAENIRADGHRHPVAPDNPFLQYEKAMSSWIVSSLDNFAKAREAWTEAVFHSTYGSPALQAAVGLKSDVADAPNREAGALQRAESQAEIAADMDRGGLLAAGIRALLHVMRGGGVDERQFNALEQIRAATPDNQHVSSSQLKSILRRQATLLRADTPRALAAIPRMLPDDPGRLEKVVATIEKVVGAKGAPDPEIAGRVAEIRQLFGVNRKGR